MNSPSRLLALAGGLLLFLLVAPLAHAAFADPPGRVARLSDNMGEVSYSPAGEDQWFSIGRNRPLTRGDRLWTDRNGRAELQFGSAAIRLGPDTSFEILELSDRIAQVQITEGTLSVSVRRMHRGQSIEVATPSLAFVIERAGRYRIDVDPDDQLTTIVVWEGNGIAYGVGSSFPLRAGDAVRFYDTDLRDYELYALPQIDSFDRYGLNRDRRLNQSLSLRYVDDDLVGYADLDEYGTWSNVSDYGHVWYPTQVRANWAPYRDGHWVWQEPWGWTWVDDAPWGFAPSHYGRWVSISGRWGWLPGPRNVRSVYAPALVAFVGGSDWGLSIGVSGGSRSGSRIGWFPLGPRDVYRPSYRASREYFTQVNITNTVVNNTTIVNVYNSYSSGSSNGARTDYAYAGLATAVTAVPGDVFRNSQPVSRAALNLNAQTLASTEILRLAPLAPNARSISGANDAARVKPSPEVFDRRVYARNAPPPAQAPFAAREQQLQRNPGMAVEPGAQPAATAERTARQHVRVIAAGAAAADARAAGSRRQDDAAVAGKPAQLRPLDRSVDSERPGEPIGRNRDSDRRDSKPPAAIQQPPPAEPAGARDAGQTTQRQAAERERANQQRNADLQQRQRDNETEQAQRQSTEAADRERANQQRNLDLQQRQRDSETEQAQRQSTEAADRERANQQRNLDLQQRQRDNEAEQAQRQSAEAAERERANQQRNADAQQLEIQQRQRDAAVQTQQRADQQAQRDAQQNAARGELERQRPQPDPHAQKPNREDVLDRRPPNQKPRKPAESDEDEELDENGNPKPRNKRDH